ncbi:MAG: acyl-CoA thioesterase II [Myxococcales bacterium]|nr:acyl-CoA thioesterase II [Myxococcales bacterium]
MDKVVKTDGRADHGEQTSPGGESMQSKVDALVRLLDVERLDLNLFRGAASHEPRPRVFGGQVAGQALISAIRTVAAESERAPHSLHAYFLRPGDPNVPIIFDVERIRDGRSFTTRRVVAIQQGEAILNMAVSFQRHEEGLSHQQAMPEVAPPEACMTWSEYVGPWVARVRERDPVAAEYLGRRRPIAMRPVNPMNLAQPEPGGMFQYYWMRADGVLPDDPLMHAALAAYASDHNLLSVAMRPHGLTPHQSGVMAASLDHAVWFHSDFRMDEWLLYAQHSPVSGQSRGLGLGHLYTRAGRLVASVCQEGLMRISTTRSESSR